MKKHHNRPRKTKPHAPPPTRPPRQDRVNFQAMVLLRERMKLYGADWETGCAIKIPPLVRQEISKKGWQRWLELLV